MSSAAYTKAEMNSAMQMMTKFKDAAIERRAAEAKAAPVGKSTKVRKIPCFAAPKPLKIITFKNALVEWVENLDRSPSKILWGARV